MGYSSVINNSLTIEIINVFMLDLEFRLQSPLLFIEDLKYHIKKRGVVVMWCVVKCKVSMKCIVN